MICFPYERAGRLYDRVCCCHDHSAMLYDRVCCCYDHSAMLYERFSTFYDHPHKKDCPENQKHDFRSSPVFISLFSSYAYLRTV